MHALTLDEFEIVQTGPDTRTQYAPFVSGGKAAYVFAIDYSINQMRRQNDRERNQVYLLTLVVVGLIFASLVTLMPVHPARSNGSSNKRRTPSSARSR